MINYDLSDLSPLGSRYAHLIQPLTLYLSEAALIQYRLLIEISFLKALSSHHLIRPINSQEHQFLQSCTKPTPSQLKRIKAIESKIHHDVKAIEYYLQNEFSPTSLHDLIPFIHIGLTSEDINNLSYRLMLTSAFSQVIRPSLHALLLTLAQLSKQYHHLPILARTHGQPAIPTTLGKEFSVFAYRLLGQLKSLDQQQFTGKLNGAVGSYQALTFAFPDCDWIKFSQEFITSLGLVPNLHTTQINPPDDIIAAFHIVHRLNSILIDLDQDCWRYISDDWLLQKGKLGHVGSSTMPQKINPIEFENSEGNLTLANGLIDTIARKLPQSRLQRDLSDSTINRNFGVILGHSLLGYHSCHSGLRSVTANEAAINRHLNANWNILSEAFQISGRLQHDPTAYHSAAKLTKNNLLTSTDWQHLTTQFPKKLQQLTPATYIGLASQLALDVHRQIIKYQKKVH